MSVFSTRPAGYKAGLLGLFLFSVLYIVGFASPYWVSVERSGSSFFGDETITAEASMGLWMFCASAEQQHACANIGVSSDLPIWFHFVRITACMGLAFLFIACVIGLSGNCCASVPKPFSRSVESWTGSGGFISLVGPIVYFTQSGDDDHYAWAIYLTIVSSACIILCCGLISSNNKPPEGVGATREALAMGQPGGGVTAVVVQNQAMQSSAYPSAPPYAGPPAYPPGPVYHVPTPDPAGYPPAFSKGYAPTAPGQF